jgi:lysophospholipase L1-like esterase
MRFPLKTGLALATAVVALAAVRVWDPGKGLSAAALSEAWRVPGLDRSPATTVEVAGSQSMRDTPQGTQSGGDVPLAKQDEPLADFLYDGSGALNSFFAALAKLDAKNGYYQVTILHYGDSPTTADLITGDVRSLLQARFGDAGHGYLLVAKPWAWYAHRDTDISGHGWTIATAVGRMRPEEYGLGGARFEGANGAESHITLKGSPQSSMDLMFLARPGGGSVAVTADDDDGKGQPVRTVETGEEEGTAAKLEVESIPLPVHTKAVDIRVANGRVQLFGETFLRQGSGILYNSLGLNGASTTVLSRAFERTDWTAALQYAAPKLVIINYGTNESSFGAFVDKQYEGELRLTIQRIRNALPNVSILVMSPVDRGERSGIDEIQTMATIPRIVAIQKRVAADTHCAFFDTFNAMGGDGTMARWYNANPRLVSGDLMHPTPQGASMVAKNFVKDLLEGYNIYKSRQPGATLAPATTAETNPQAQEGVHQ